MASQVAQLDALGIDLCVVGPQKGWGGPAGVSVVTVSDLMAWLGARSAGHAAAFADKAMIKAAVDQTHVPVNAAIINAKEVAFFPPVTGG